MKFQIKTYLDNDFVAGFNAIVLEHHVDVVAVQGVHVQHMGKLIEGLQKSI